MKKDKSIEEIIVDDLQNQVREHIKSHDLFDWHEALTENEMSLLENLLLTFAPMFSPGSIGYAKTVQPYLSQNLAREKEYRKALEVVHDLFERFMPKEVAMDDYKQMAMYEAYHRIKQLLKPLNNV